MILVDTSIWIDHLRQSNEPLTRLLNQGQVLAHPYVIGELALGHPPESRRDPERATGFAVGPGCHG